MFHKIIIIILPITFLNIFSICAAEHGPCWDWARGQYQRSFYGHTLEERLRHLPELLKAVPRTVKIQQREFVVPESIRKLMAHYLLGYNSGAISEKGWNPAYLSSKDFLSVARTELVREFPNSFKVPRDGTSEEEYRGIKAFLAFWRDAFLAAGGRVSRRWNSNAIKKFTHELLIEIVIHHYLPVFLHSEPEAFIRSILRGTEGATPLPALGEDILAVSSGHSTGVQEFLIKLLKRLRNKDTRRELLGKYGSDRNAARLIFTLSSFSEVDLRNARKRKVYTPYNYRAPHISGAKDLFSDARVLNFYRQSVWVLIGGRAVSYPELKVNKDLILEKLRIYYVALEPAEQTLVDSNVISRTGFTEEEVEAAFQGLTNLNLLLVGAKIIPQELAQEAGILLPEVEFRPLFSDAKQSLINLARQKITAAGTSPVPLASLITRLTGSHSIEQEQIIFQELHYIETLFGGRIGNFIEVVIAGLDGGAAIIKGTGARNWLEELVIQAAIQKIMDETDGINKFLKREIYFQSSDPETLFYVQNRGYSIFQSTRFANSVSTFNKVIRERLQAIKEAWQN